MAQLSNDELKEHLLDAYNGEVTLYPETEQVKTLKNELYHRGYQWGDVVTIALASCIHRRREAFRRAG
jgi:hypothetical protein